MQQKFILDFCLKILILYLIISLKYEGMSAKEWENEKMFIS